ncbi:5'-3' exonuclease [Parahaliea aestuarii]|uniref:Flap endonuclease n=1 Tax=Parahaliea aestuarii TaxID=1852021 RepID=A0A5C8ZU55_9GAMM|nr:5'-3' exonuclease H3TH domain-containing protein [Parahaliea aestuarii]TXS90987.1 flap endonuclease [Parahaliea aestuarii]
MPQRAWLLDASIYIFRAWFSLPDRWHSPDGMPLNAVVGYAGFLASMVERCAPQALLAAAFDESLGTCFRNAIYPGYKASRSLPDETLAFQLHACRELTERLGLPCYGGPDYEADDYLATLARLCREAGYPVTLVSRDKDLGQLLFPGDALWDAAADQALDADGFRQRFGVLPRQFPDYQGLVGDAIDDIPGVPGVGARSTVALLTHFDSLDALAVRLDEVAGLPLRGASGLQRKLEAHWPQALMSRELARLESAVPGVSDVPRWRMDLQSLEAVRDYLQALGLGGRLLQRWQQLAARVAA